MVSTMVHQAAKAVGGERNMSQSRSRSSGQDALQDESTGEGSVKPRAHASLLARSLGAIGLIALLAGGAASACAGGSTVEPTASSGSGGGAGGTGGNGISSTVTGTGGNAHPTSGITTATGSGGTGGAASGTTTGGGGNGGSGGASGSSTTATSGSTTASASSGGCVPTTETCNGFDDDCNGTVDDGDPGSGAACVATGVFGICTVGTIHCKNGALKCMPGSPQPETCNGLDDNCDSFVDEGILPGVGMQCSTGLQGLCAIGLTTCGGAAGVSCTASVAPGQLPESCNGQDDNCDGLVDEGIPQVGMPCTAPGNVGVCQFGNYVCPTQGPFQLTCEHPLPGTTQEICNGKDDDCNGTIDDPMLVNGQPCNTGLLGVCAAGVTQCAAGSQSCNPIQAAQTELCNNKDDDCNGVIDDIPNVNVACQSQLPGAGHVQNWQCGMATCQISTCGTGYANIDGASGNGCECASDSYAQTCGNASTIAVPIGGTATMTGVIESAAGSDFAIFAFSDKPVGSSFHPKIQITNSAGGQYAMTVLDSCNVPATCNDGGNGSNSDVWEATFDSAAPGTYQPGPGCCADNTPHPINQIVRVFRKNGDAPTCVAYTITASNP
jgi:putative metal-binding protein